MDVDVPERRIDSIKDFLLHMGTVTLGILIALGLEGIREWVHEHNLVREARASLVSELRDNQLELARTLGGIPRTRTNLKDALALIARVANLKPEETLKINFSVGFRDASLLGVNRSTAETTGALAHMSYGEVRKYAALYDTQQKFMHIQQRFLDQFTLLMTALQSGGKDLPSKAELDGTRQNFLVGLALLNYTEQVGQQLARSYQEALR